MLENPVSKKGLILASIFSLLIIFLTFNFSYFDQRTKIVFCQVGQGDAAYIRIKNKIDILIDAGPDKKILNCLGKYMPFWDRKIELAIISHPQKDHFGGFLYLLDRYQIAQIYLTPLDNSSQSFKQLKRKINEKKIPLFFPFAGTEIRFANNSLYFYWPTEEFVRKNTLAYQINSHQKNDLKTSHLDANHFSLVFLFKEHHPSVKEKTFRVLFTGDATVKVLNEISFLYQHQLKTDILKVPHHGSKNGLTQKFLDLAAPKIAVISVGERNPHGHPTKEILEMLKAKNITIRRTDIEGNLVIKLPSRFK